MPRLALLLGLLLAQPVFAQPDWEAEDLGTTEDFHALYRGSFLPWVVGTNGFVASVANDFTTWTVRDIGTTEDLLSIIGPNASSRTIAGRNGTYRYTNDGGATWQSLDLPDTTQDYVAVRPNSTYFALGSGGALYADLLGNPVAWVERMSGTTAALRAAESTSVLMAFGDDGTILRANNIVGEEWEAVESGTTADLHAVAVQGSNWLVVGEGGLILKSTDNGATWTPRASGTTATLYALDSITGLRYLVVGENGTLLETTDFGETWCAHSLPTTATLRAVTVPASDNWFVAGDGGVMLRSQTQGGGNCTPVANEPGASPSGYTLSPAWPNPMTDRAALALTVDRPQHVTAEVFDLLGRHVAVVFDGLVAAGAPHTLVFERSGFPAGIYVVRVAGETFTASRSVSLTR